MPQIDGDLDGLGITRRECMGCGSLLQHEPIIFIYSIFYYVLSFSAARLDSEVLMFFIFPFAGAFAGRVL